MAEEQLRIRKAKVADARPIHKMLMDCARDGLLLPRSFHDLYRHLREFYVVVSPEGEVHGCCALSIAWEDLAEIRSLVIGGHIQRRGWGRKLVDACLSEALTLGIYRVLTLTYQVEFFKRMGFIEVSKDIVPQKMWADCLNCPKFPECDETAMILDL
ncbi:MAG: N-acetyltransferase [Desulfovibrionaceae bacterium]|jgi:amino-acid N-acetyltransferase|nr:N-acetyltransferase [Desulfovibrionaceae bacterium]